MRIAILLCFTIALLAPVFGAKPSHLSDLRSRYPYGLIGDDYGVLTQEDLAVNTCNAFPVEFSNGGNLAYSYWQCFPSKDARMTCSSLGYDSLIKKELMYLNVYAKAGQISHSYLARGPMEIRACKSGLRAWKRITRGEKHVCVSGIYVDVDAPKSGRQVTNWVLDKFKTNRGCEAYRSECRMSTPPEPACVLPANWKVRSRI